MARNKGKGKGKGRKGKGRKGKSKNWWKPKKGKGWNKKLTIGAAEGTVDADWMNQSVGDLGSFSDYKGKKGKKAKKAKAKIAMNLLPGLTKDWNTEFGGILDDDDQPLYTMDTDWYRSNKSAKQEKFDSLGIDVATEEMIYNKDINNDGKVGPQEGSGLTDSWNTNNNYDSAVEKQVKQFAGDPSGPEDNSKINYGNFDAVNYKDLLINNPGGSKWTKELESKWDDLDKDQRWTEYFDALGQTKPSLDLTNVNDRTADKIDWEKKAEEALKDGGYDVSWNPDWNDLNPKAQAKNYGYITGTTPFEEINQDNYQGINWAKKFDDAGWTADSGAFTEENWTEWDAKDRFQVGKQFNAMASGGREVSFDQLTEDLRIKGTKKEEIEEQDPWEEKEPEPLLYTQEDIFGDADKDNVWGYSDIYESDREGIAATGTTDKFKGDAQADWLGKRKGMEMFNVGDVNESGGVPFQPDYSTKSWTNLGSKIAKGWSAEGGLGITAKKTKAAETGDKFKGTKQFATV